MGVNLKKKLQKKAGDASKGAALEECKKLAQEAVDNKSKFVVAIISAQGKAKIMAKAVTAFGKVAPEVPFLCMSEVKAGGKMAAVASVPKGLEGKLAANQWLGETLKQCG